MRRPAISIVVASCLLLASCSGSGSGSGSDGDASTTAASTTATTIATTTTEPPTPTTEPPTTTIDTDAQLAAAEEAYLDAFDAYIAAARDPSNPDLRAEIERLYTGPSLEFTISQLDGFVREGWVARPGNEQEPSRAIILQDSSFFPDRPDIAELVSCEINSDVFVEPGAAPDGSDALVNDEMTVDRALIRLEYIDGLWRVRSGETLANLSAPEDCVP